MPPLQFQPLASQPSPTFWSALNTLKLDKLKLDDAQQAVTAWLEEGKSIIDKEHRGLEAGEASIGVDGVLGVDGAAFGGEGDRPPPGSHPVQGIFKNFNTIEQFKSTEEKKALFDQVTDRIVASFDGDEPDLHQFLLVTFADLKKYVYQYWFAFPALVSKPGWELQGEMQLASDEDVREARQLEPASSSSTSLGSNGFLMRGPAGQRSASSLGQATTFFAEVPENERWLVFHDPSSLPQNPGWPLRNILYYLAHQHSITTINILCLRSGSSSRSGLVSLPGVLETGKPTAVGWERNKAGKLASRVADLGPMLDPARLADQAVDLNLKLMRWRIMPSLDLEKVASTKCLLLGAGTLGCYVARSLMGWGIRNITFVDSARVSYSNPVRQPLFDFEDCLDGGKPKAQCAADRLRKIFPGVNAQAHSFMIPMPGHPVPPASEAQTQADVKQLEDLVASHEAVFLLMDSRESRWLPTVLGAAQGKIVINAALGFDSFLVMRHGAAPGAQEDKERLGCYYCNDVVAPTDSLTDRTLDQMCTVTRPGIAPIASATAVELLTSLLQHPLGLSAPAEGASNTPAPASTEVGSCLGLVPHQLRGGLSSWKTTLIKGEAYPQCTACSQTVVDAYQEQGWAMLKRAFGETGYLEKLTGLDKLQEESERRMRELEEMDEGSEEDDF